MIPALLGFVIALAVGLTGIGGGSFAVPALLLLVGLPASAAVGSAFVFAGVLRFIAAPFYLLGGIGLLLAGSSSLTFVPRMQNPRFARENSHWLPWLAFPIGIESGFSSAGAGALGTVLLLNYSEMPAAQVVGTDLFFGLVLAVIGSTAHWALGSISLPVLLRFVAGGVPGVVLGCLLASKVPARKLRSVIALVAIAAGLQLAWSGARTLASRQFAQSSSSARGTQRP